MSILINTLIKGWVACLVFATMMLHAAKPLPAEQAFVPSISRVDAQTIDIHIDILPDYYLYRERRFAVSSPDGTLRINDIALSAGSDKNDAFFGAQSVWYGGKNAADISVAYDNPQQLAQTTLTVAYQGCLDGVICYPRQRVELPVTLPVPSSLGQSLGQSSEQSAVQSATSAHNGLFKRGKQQSTDAVQASVSLVSVHKDALLTNEKEKEKTTLSEDEAFPFSIEAIDATTLQLHFRVADGYYLYRDKTQLTAVDLSNPDAPSPLADIAFSSGDKHSDAFYGEQVVYRGETTVANIYLKHPVAELALHLQFQGCAEKGICYPIMNREVRLQNGFVSSVSVADAQDSGNLVDKIAATLRDNLWAGIGLLLVAGIALSFTPCVLPMLPILLGIVTNQRKVSKPRALLLSSAYALGVAVMMAVFGLVVAKTGINIQIIFQQPLWLMLFATIFIAMGLAMLGVFNVAMPNGVQNRVIAWQNRLQNSNVGSLFVVGALSTLVVGPCVAPPLIAVLAFISTTGDSVLGALYLFALGLGMSLPLVVFASLVTTIPRTSALSRLVTRVFAMLMFGVGLWLLGRLLPGALSLALWGAFMVVVAWLFWRSGFVKSPARYLAKAVAVLSLLLGGAWLLGGAMGNSNPLKPFTQIVKLPFTAINDHDSLQKALQNSDKPVMLDLYADWCVSCQEVEHFTLTDAQVANALEDFTLLKLDISETSDAHRHLLKELNLIGPPVMLFFVDGNELHNKRHVGAISVKTLLETLKSIRYQARR